jgi:hypothetical protein
MANSSGGMIGYDDNIVHLLWPVAPSSVVVATSSVVVTPSSVVVTPPLIVVPSLIVSLTFGVVFFI